MATRPVTSHIRMRKSDSADGTGVEMTHFIGIDVSKAKLDVALLLSNDKIRSKSVANSTEGWQLLWRWLLVHADAQGAGLHVCMESTGAYHEGVATFLHDQAATVSVVNPMLVKRFAESAALRVKTDRLDAQTLARFARERRPAAWEAPSKALRALQALVARLDTLLEMRHMECNRLDIAHESVRSSHQQVIDELDRQAKEVRRLIRQTVDDDPDLGRRSELLQTIPGLGERTIAQLLAYIGRPERFESAKALCAYAGLAPWIRQSGTSLDKRRGTHPMGHALLRRSLYFPAMVAGRFNPIIARFWNRLKAQNKPGKVIVVACMHKLLAIVYGVLVSGRPFRNSDEVTSTA